MKKLIVGSLGARRHAVGVLAATVSLCGLWMVGLAGLAAAALPHGAHARGDAPGFGPAGFTAKPGP